MHHLFKHGTFFHFAAGPSVLDYLSLFSYSSIVLYLCSWQKHNMYNQIDLQHSWCKSSSLNRKLLCTIQIAAYSLGWSTKTVWGGFLVSGRRRRSNWIWRGKFLVLKCHHLVEQANCFFFLYWQGLETYLSNMSALTWGIMPGHEEKDRGNLTTCSCGLEPNVKKKSAWALH